MTKQWRKGVVAGRIIRNWFLYVAALSVGVGQDTIAQRKLSLFRKLDFVSSPGQSSDRSRKNAEIANISAQAILLRISFFFFANSEGEDRIARNRGSIFRYRLSQICWFPFFLSRIHSLIRFLDLSCYFIWTAVAFGISMKAPY